MYCRECGEKLALRFCENEGLIPYCNKCESFMFPQFNSAVSMLVTNRAQNKVLLAKHVNENDYILFAGFIKKGESAEKTVVREIREETKLNVVKHKYTSSKYHPPRDVLMLNFIVVVEDNVEPVLNEEEIAEAKWFDLDEAKQVIRKNSTAEYFLLNAIDILKKKI